MYIPIRNTGDNSAENEDCIKCPRNFLVYLHPHQRYILTPVPAISICHNFARRSGRVHVAVVSGPRPGQRLYAGRYQVELMVWKAEGPVYSCKHTILVKGKRQVTMVPKKLHCPRPKQPSNGILFCDSSDSKHYPHNSVCQIFCDVNYLVENSSRNSSRIICKNGQWSPEDRTSCVAAFCPELPSLTAHGYWSCDVEDSTKSFSNGTRCKVSCAAGYVIPSSQLKKDTVVCRPPSWDHLKTISKCTRAHLPKLLQCQNRHLIVRTGQLVKMSTRLLPKGATHTGVSLKPVCSLQSENLSKGKHQNVCEVTDPEVKTKRTCSYKINIEESSGPHPNAGDCKNRTFLANRKGTFHSKPVRFFVKVGEPARKRIIRGNCNPRGDLKVGNHLIVCKATDPHTKVTGTCSYWFKVQKRSCPPLPQIPNGQVVCTSDDVGAICHYKCNEGYSFPSHHLIRTTKTCQFNMKWQPFQNPSCEIIPPQLLEGCSNLEVELSSSGNFTVPWPKYLTALNRTLNISCIPPLINIAGQYRVSCGADDELFNVSCQFNVTVSSKEELSTDTPQEDELPELIEGCDDLQINMSAPIHFNVPKPRYLKALNETLNASCTPSLFTAAGQHEVNCTTEDNTFNASCHFIVLILLEDSPTTETVSENDKLPEVIEGCEDLQVNMSVPVHFNVPRPRYLTALNETLNASCTPSLITAAGQHEVNCTTEDDTFNMTCHFDVIILLEDSPTTETVSENDKLPELIEGCEDLQVNTSSPVHFNVPRPRYLTALNETFNASCTPSLLTAAGQHEVNCKTEDDTFNVSCHFSVIILLEQNPTTETFPENGEAPELIEGCDDIEVSLSAPVHYNVPLPLYRTVWNETLNVSCIPFLLTVAGQYEITCTVDDDIFNVSCPFNVTILLEELIPTVSAEKTPKFVEGCNDIEVNASLPISFTVPQPTFLSASNDTLLVSCVPSLITTFGYHEVNCVVDDYIFNTSCHFNVTLFQEDKVTTVTTIESNSCKPLVPLPHSSIECSTVEHTEICQITCDLGYGFSEDNSLTVVCLGGSDGLWDFQKFDANATLPVCFAQVKGSAVEMWISFEAFAPHCEEEIEEQMRDVVNELCHGGTDCSKVFINCTLDEESDMMLMIVNWTVRADFNDEEYYDDEEIPEAEIRLESVLEKTQTFLATEAAPEGTRLFPDSFRRGLMTLVCPNGFIPNMLMAKCIICPKEVKSC